MTYGRGSYRKKRNSGFNPNQKYVNEAVERFLSEGREITKVSLDYDYFMTSKNQVGTADEFLMGQ